VQLRQFARDHVAEDVNHLLRRARGRLRSPVDLLQRMVELGIVKGDDRLSEGDCVTGVEGGIPLAVLVAKADDDYVGGTNQRLGANRVNPSPLVVAPEGLRLLAQRPRPSVIGSGVVSDRGRKRNRQPRLSRAGLDPLAPVGVDLAGEVDLPAPLAQEPASSKCLLSIVT
jgi:hypothetical protein